MKFKVNNKYVVDAQSHEEAIRVTKLLKDNMFKIKKSINIDDATASGTADLTRIINEWLGRIKKTGKYDREDIDINGKRVKGRIKLSWNGMPVLSFYPNGGSFYVFKNGSSGLDIPYDRNSMTVKQSDINKLVGEIFEASDKANEIMSLKNEKPKVVGYVLEGIEGDQSSVARRQMLNKTVSYDKILSFLKTEDDKFRASGKKGYDKAYIDVIYSLGKHKYRVHGARFDVGDGNVDSTLRRELGFPEREIEKFKQTGYSMYVKQVDSVKDERIFLRYLFKSALEYGTIQKVNGKIYSSARPGEEFASEQEALNYSLRHGWKEISKEEWNKYAKPKDSVIEDEEVSLDYLIKDEIEAINGYKAMIAKTKNPKLLDVLSHILSEEVMHVEELRNAQSGNFEIVDSVKDEYLRTPRGSFELVNESEEMLRHKGWGMWFEHIENGKFYRIMHDPKTQHAVAVFVKNINDSFYDMADMPQGNPPLKKTVEIIEWKNSISPSIIKQDFERYKKTKNADLKKDILRYLDKIKRDKEYDMNIAKSGNANVSPTDVEKHYNQYNKIFEEVNKELNLFPKITLDSVEDEISPEKQVGLKVTMRDPNYIDFTITNDNQNLYRYEKATGKMRKILGFGPNNFGNSIRGIDRKKVESVAKEVFERNLPFAIIA